MNNKKKFLAVTLIGTMIEWLEFIYFMKVISIIATQFTSLNVKNVIYMLIMSSYISRPLGAIIFGVIGDRFGRKPAVLASILLMSVASLSIALLPNYQTIGVLATILLFLIRTIQCLALPGEFTGAALLTLENPDFKDRTFFYTSFIPFAASCGILLASFTSFIVTLDTIPDWGWRVPFIITGVIGILTTALRSSIYDHFKPSEISLSRKTSKANAKPDKMIFSSVFCFAALISLWVYLGNVFFEYISKENVLGPIPNIAIVLFIGQLLATILMPTIGWIADVKKNGYSICKAGIFFAIIFAFPLSYTHTTNNIYLILIGQIIYAIINGMLSATLFTITFREFGKKHRFLAAGTAWNIGSTIFGGTALMIATKLNDIASGYGIGLYIAITAAITLIIYHKTNLTNPH